MDTDDPLVFPRLPAAHMWPHQIVEAHALLLQSYSTAVRLLQTEDGEPVRLRTNAHHIQNHSIPILRALEIDMPNNTDWIELCTEKIMTVVLDLETMAKGIDSRSRENLKSVTPVRAVRTGRKGRPQKSIERRWLEDAFAPHRNLSISALANAIGVHRNTLSKYLKLHGISKGFSEISDNELDILLQHLKLQKPNAGLRYAVGFLRKRGIKTQQKRVQLSMGRIDSVGQALRDQRRIQREVYQNPHINAVWHMDGHHKLIRWGIVIHGFVDGFDRMIVSLKAHTDNRASTVLLAFLDAVERFGAPARVRGDRGGENVDVSVWMILHQGPNRSSFLWGDSPRNVRAERMWVEVGSQVVRRWRAFFGRLERIHHLNIDTWWHPWLLQFLFLAEINENLKEFVDDWNHHPLSRLGHDKSPADMRMMGELRHGRYVSRTEIHPGVTRKYGNLGRNELEERVAQDQARKVRHDAVETPRNQSPFEDQAQENTFRDAVHELDAIGEVPVGFGVAEGEWTANEYPESEVILIARKQVDIVLPFQVWWPRAVRWARALQLLLVIDH